MISPLKRIFGFASRQVEAFERRQDQRLETVLERLESVREGIRRALDSQGERTAAARQRQQDLMLERQESLGDGLVAVAELLQANNRQLDALEAGQINLSSAMAELRRASDQQQEALTSGLGSLGRALESIGRGLGQGAGQQDELRQALDAVNALASGSQARHDELRARLEEGHARQGDLARLLVAANEELKRLSEGAPAQLLTELNQQLDALAAAFLDQRVAMQGLAYQLRIGSGEDQQLELITRLDSLESTLSELRLHLADTPADALQNHLDMHGRLESMEATLAELRLSVGRRDDAAVPAGLEDRFDALEAAMAELRLSAVQQHADPRIPAGMEHRFDALEGALAELRLSAKRPDDALPAGMEHRFDALEATLAELRLSAKQPDDALPGLEGRFDALEATLAELRLSAKQPDDALPGLEGRFDALEATLAELRLSAKQPDDALPGLEGRFDALEATLAELRLGDLGQAEARMPGDLATRMDSLEGLLSELRLHLSGEGDEKGAAEICARLDGLEGALSQLRLDAPGDGRGSQAVDLGHRLETVESALSELRLQLAEGAGDAEVIRREVGQRFEELESALSEIRLPMARLTEDAATGQESREVLAALDATLSEQRLTLQKLQASLSTSSPRDVMDQLHSLEAMISEESQAFGRLVASSRDQQQVLRQEFDALEGIIGDQRHALHKLVTSFDSQGYAQRLEVQKRLSALDTELRSMLTAIEAGISDQHYALARLAGTMVRTGEDGEAESSWGGHTPIAQILGEPKAVAAGPALGRHPDMEYKLGIILDCLLADHLASLARTGKEEGTLDEAACRRLTDALDQLKLKRLKSRHLGGEDTKEVP